MNIYLIIYVIISAAIVLGGTMKLYNDMMVGAILFCLGSSAVCVIYGLRWFSLANGLLAQTPVIWPPTINTCPDYLTYYEVMEGVAKRRTCIDTVGVSKNGTMSKFPEGTPPQYSADSPYYLLIDTVATDPLAKNNELCTKALLRGLAWEGITNGEACITSTGTRAPSSGSSSCPQG